MGDPDGVPILLLHGFTDSARSWSFTAPYLATGFRVIAPDLRGHGHSDQPEGCYTISEMANDVRLLMVALDLAPCHVVGHSLGGRLVQALAERWPHLVRKIILMSTSAALGERRGWLWENRRCAIRLILKAHLYGNGLLAQFRSTRISLPLRDAKAPRCRQASGIQFITSSLPMIRRRSCRIFPRQRSSCGAKRI
nr:alpha/beta hydrolase [Sinorhizobium meliloti]